MAKPKLNILNHIVMKVNLELEFLERAMTKTQELVNEFKNLSRMEDQNGNPRDITGIIYTLDRLEAFTRDLKVNHRNIEQYEQALFQNMEENRETWDRAYGKEAVTRWLEFRPKETR